MLHLEIGKNRWVNSAHIVSVDYKGSNSDADGYLHLRMVNGDEPFVAKTYWNKFLETYKRLCVAHPRPEVG